MLFPMYNINKRRACTLILFVSRCWSARDRESGIRNPAPPSPTKNPAVTQDSWLVEGQEGCGWRGWGVGRVCRLRFLVLSFCCRSPNRDLQMHLFLFALSALYAFPSPAPTKPTLREVLKISSDFCVLHCLAPCIAHCFRVSRERMDRAQMYAPSYPNRPESLRILDRGRSADYGAMPISEEAAAADSAAAVSDEESLLFDEAEEMCKVGGPL